MDSDESTVEQGSTELKTLVFLKKIAAIFLALLSNVYAFIKEHLGISDKAVASFESTVTSVIGPVDKKVESFLDKILVFADDKIDKYAPSPVKNVLAELDPHIDNVSDAANQVAEKTRSLVGGIPLLGNVLGGISQTVTNTTEAAQEVIDRTTSLVTDNPITQAVNTAADQMMQEAQSAGKKAALKSVYASLSLLLVPLIAELWYKANTKEWFSKLADMILPLIEKLCNWYNDMLETMEDKGYSFFGYLPTIPIIEMKAAYKLVKTTNDSLAAVADGLEDVGEIVDNIPIVGNIADSITNTADQMMDAITDNPLTQAVESAAGEMMQETQAVATKAALKSVYAALTLLLCPAIAEICYKLSAYAPIKALGKAILPVIEKLCESYNNKIEELDEKGHSFFGYLPTIPITEMKVAYKLVKTANAGLEAVEDVVGLNDEDD
ncbi:hypothetical protein L1887_14903 [Cichorium endivia]|nr:hypothetical protein L1887_14903 [Cichorium endivia]